MTIRAGKMRQRIRIEVRSDIQSASGEPAYTWTLFRETWAAVEPLLGRELFAAQERQAKVSTRFRMRYVAGVKPRMRIVWDSRWFDIESIQQVNGLKYEMVVMANEQVERALQ